MDTAPAMICEPSGGQDLGHESKTKEEEDMKARREAVELEKKRMLSSLRANAVSKLATAKFMRRELAKNLRGPAAVLDAYLDDLTETVVMKAKTRRLQPNDPPNLDEMKIHQWHRRCWDSWTPDARIDAGIAVVGDYLYCFGGKGGSAGVTGSFSRLDLTTRSSWEQVPNLGNVPDPRAGHAMLAIDTKIWIFGGETITTEAPRRRRFLNDIRVFDTVDGQWAEPATRNVLTGALWPTARQGHSMTYMPNYGEEGGLVVFGGSGPHPVTGENLLSNETFVFDMKACTWARVPDVGDVPNARCFHAAAMVPCLGRMYVAGGITTPVVSSGQQPFNSGAAADGDSMESMHEDQHLMLSDSTSVPVLTSKVEARMSASGEISFVGCYEKEESMAAEAGISSTSRLRISKDSETLASGDLFALDTTSWRWSKVEVSGTAIPRLQGLTAIVHPGGRPKIFFFGGQGEAAVFSTGVFMLDADTNTVSLISRSSSFPAPRSHHSATVSDRQMIVFGGYNGSGLLPADVYTFRLQDSLPEAPVPPPPKTRRFVTVVARRAVDRVIPKVSKFLFGDLEQANTNTAGGVASPAIASASRAPTKRGSSHAPSSRPTPPLATNPGNKQNGRDEVVSAGRKPSADPETLKAGVEPCLPEQASPPVSHERLLDSEGKRQTPVRPALLPSNSSLSLPLSVASGSSRAGSPSPSPSLGSCFAAPHQSPLLPPTSLLQQLSPRTLPKSPVRGVRQHHTSSTKSALTSSDFRGDVHGFFSQHSDLRPLPDGHGPQSTAMLPEPSTPLLSGGTSSHVNLVGTGPTAPATAAAAATATATATASSTDLSRALTTVPSSTVPARDSNFTASVVTAAAASTRTSNLRDSTGFCSTATPPSTGNVPTVASSHSIARKGSFPPNEPSVAGSKPQAFGGWRCADATPLVVPKAKPPSVDLWSPTASTTLLGSKPLGSNSTVGASKSRPKSGPARSGRRADSSASQPPSKTTLTEGTSETAGKKARPPSHQPAPSTVPKALFGVGGDVVKELPGSVPFDLPPGLYRPPSMPRVRLPDHAENKPASNQDTTKRDEKSVASSPTDAGRPQRRHSAGQRRTKMAASKSQRQQLLSRGRSRDVQSPGPRPGTQEEPWHEDPRERLERAVGLRQSPFEGRPFTPNTTGGSSVYHNGPEMQHSRPLTSLSSGPRLRPAQRSASAFEPALASSRAHSISRAGAGATPMNASTPHACLPVGRGLQSTSQRWHTVSTGAGDSGVLPSGSWAEAHHGMAGSTCKSVARRPRTSCGAILRRAPPLGGRASPAPGRIPPPSPVVSPRHNTVRGTTVTATATSSHAARKHVDVLTIRHGDWGQQPPQWLSTDSLLPGEGPPPGPPAGIDHDNASEDSFRDEGFMHDFEDGDSSAMLPAWQPTRFIGSSGAPTQRNALSAQGEGVPGPSLMCGSLVDGDGEGDGRGDGRLGAPASQTWTKSSTGKELHAGLSDPDFEYWNSSHEPGVLPSNSVKTLLSSRMSWASQASHGYGRPRSRNGVTSATTSGTREATRLARHSFAGSRVGAGAGAGAGRFHGSLRSQATTLR